MTRRGGPPCRDSSVGSRRTLSRRCANGLSLTLHQAAPIQNRRATPLEASAVNGGIEYFPASQPRTEEGAPIVEAVWQLRGEAGDRRVADAKVALTHRTAGGISGLDHGACAVHVPTS